MMVIIDRFEGGFAVCECDDKTIINIEIKKLPNNINEGDVLVINGDKIIVDYEETSKRKREILNLTKNMWE